MNIATLPGKYPSAKRKIKKLNGNLKLEIRKREKNAPQSTCKSITDSSRGLAQKFRKNFAKYLRNICEIFAKNLRKICEKFAKNLQKIVATSHFAKSFAL